MKAHWETNCLLLSLALLAGCHVGFVPIGGDAEGDTTGDGDGDSADGDPDTGDGDGDTGDGDGDGSPATDDGDPDTGDGDPDTGDGDPDTGDGDGDGDGDPSDSGPATDDGDPDTGDGDGDTGDGDGDADTGDTGEPNNCMEFAECGPLLDAFWAETEAIRSCSTDAECGQVLPGTSCGCTRDWVARIDADTTCFYDLVDQASSLQCELPFISTCDCPGTNGYVCEAGTCNWNYF